MTVPRALILLLLAAAVAAGILAIASRTPEPIRDADPPADATDASNGSSFTDEDIARHGAYRRPGYISIALQLALQVIVLVVLARSIVPALVSRISNWPGGWVTTAAVVTITIVVVAAVTTLPASYVRGFMMEHAWGLSTQTTWGWLNDQARSMLVSSVTALVTALAFIGLVRAFPRSWWLWGWAAFSLLAVVFAFLWPIVIAPLFNKFTPLDSGPLRERIVQLGDEAGVELEDVLVADASKRTTAENAYVAGIGASKRMVLYDTLLKAGDENETAYVAAHELGHDVHEHIWKGVALTSVSLAVGFAVLRFLATRDGLWSWAGASDLGDPRALPVLVLLLLIGGLLSLPLQNGVSRKFEREADRVAISLTDDPHTAVSVYRRLAFSNLADLRPPRIAVWALFTHPPIPERIEDVLSGAEQRTSS